MATTQIINIDGLNHDAIVTGRYNVIVQTVCGLRFGPDDEVSWGQSTDADGCLSCREA